MCVHLLVSMNNGKTRHEIRKDKIAVCEKTVGLRCGKFSDSKSASSNVLVSVEIFQFQDMLNENSFLGTFRAHSKRPISSGYVVVIVWVSVVVYDWYK